MRHSEQTSPHQTLGQYSNQGTGHHKRFGPPISSNRAMAPAVVVWVCRVVSTRWTGQGGLNGLFSRFSGSRVLTHQNDGLGLAAEMPAKWRQSPSLFARG